MLRLRSSLRGQGKWVLLSSIALGLLIAPFAVAGDGDVMKVGAGNSAGVNETRIIGQNVSTYTTRQSNNKQGDGGAATYGCRSDLGNEPCLFVFALKTAHAFDFRSRGKVGGQILVAGDPNPRNNAPFTTNATGVATGLNADEVDGKSADTIQNDAVKAGKPRVAAVNADATLNSAASNGVASVVRPAGEGDGTYDVKFSATVANCAVSATITDYVNSGAAAAQIQPGASGAQPDTVRVRTRAGGGSDGTGPTNVADKPFNLVLNCP
jgi:hypothetical protein